MDEPIQARLLALPPELDSLARFARRYLTRGDVHLLADGTLLIGPAPWIGTEGFSFVLFPPAEPRWLANFEQRFGPIPSAYARILAAMNGCFAFGLALYGLAPSMQRTPPLLDRRTRQPLDLSLANDSWAREFQGAGRSFHLGGREWSDTDNVGYFLTGSTVVEARRTAGAVVRTWTTITEFLAEELEAAEVRDHANRPADV